VRDAGAAASADQQHDDERLVDSTTPTTKQPDALSWWQGTDEPVGVQAERTTDGTNDGIRWCLNQNPSLHQDTRKSIDHRAGVGDSLTWSGHSHPTPQPSKKKL
jgi:hypothetical protein